MPVRDCTTGYAKLGNPKDTRAGAMGFHGDLINDGVFDDNQGLTGFYSFQAINLNGLGVFHRRRITIRSFPRN